MVSVEKICYDSNQTKNTFNRRKTTDLTFLLPTMVYLIDVKMN